MYKLKAYSHQIAPIGEDGQVTNLQFRAISGTEAVMQYLAKLLGGKTNCSSCGVVQYSDEIILTRELSESTCKWIEKNFPFISTYNAKCYYIEYKGQKIKMNPNNH